MDEALRNIQERLTLLEARLNILEDIKYELKKISANSQLIVHTVQMHGTTIQHLENTLSQIKLHCPLLGLDATDVPCFGKKPARI